jgi:glycosyltransferase involved in cell wall biosynthesis
MGFLYAPGMRAELDRLVPRMDVVHTHMPFVYPTYAASRAALRHGKPLFYHQRGVFDPERLRFRGLKKRLYIRAFELPVMKRAASLIALTGAEEDSYRALGVDTPCRVIPNGIDASKFRQRPAGEPEPGIPPSATVILFMSRVHPVKGADRLLEAFFRVQADFPDAVLVVAGPDEWGMEAKYREAVSAAGLHGRVLFPGMVSGERKLDLLARADLFCLPSDAEGFSMAVLEALASATPVLLSPGCHFPEVERAGAGVVAPAEPVAIAAALAGLLPDRERLADMGRAGLALVSRDYNWDRIAGRLLDAYADAVRQKEARKP